MDTVSDWFDLLGFVDSLFDLRYYQYAPGRWFVEKLLGGLGIGCIALACIFREQVLVLILGLLAGIALLVCSMIYHGRTFREYLEIRELEGQMVESRKKKSGNNP